MICNAHEHFQKFSKEFFSQIFNFFTQKRQNSIDIKTFKTLLFKFNSNQGKSIKHHFMSNEMAKFVNTRSYVQNLALICV